LTNEHDCASLELHALEKLREEELEEARAIQSVMLPAESLRAGAVMNFARIPAGVSRGRRFSGLFPAIGRNDRSFTFAMFRQRAAGRAVTLHWRWYTARGAQNGHIPGDAPRHVQPAAHDPRHASRHAAIQYAVFDPPHNVLHIASAGMPGPFHICAEGCRSLELSGIPRVCSKARATKL